MDIGFQQAMHKKIRRLIEHLQSSLIGRDQEARLILLAALAKQHSLLIGKPGTAKSLLASRLANVFALPQNNGEREGYFQLLMMRFTKPDEVFGPLDIKELQESRYRRQTNAYLPNAQVAFLDEIFKANSAILNSLLTLLNERTFNNGEQRLRNLNLVSVVGASNELPRSNTVDTSADALAALYDRFLVRQWIENVSDEEFPLLTGAFIGTALDPTVWKECEVSQVRATSDELQEHERITFEQLDKALVAARHVLIPLPVFHAVTTLRKLFASRALELATAQSTSETGSSSRPQFYVSDRRWKWILEFLQVAAWYDNRTAVTYSDLALLPYLVACHEDDVLPVRTMIANLDKLWSTQLSDRILDTAKKTISRLPKQDKHQAKQTSTPPGLDSDMSLQFSALSGTIVAVEEMLAVTQMDLSALHANSWLTENTITKAFSEVKVRYSDQCVADLTAIREATRKQLDKLATLPATPPTPKKTNPKSELPEAFSLSPIGISFSLVDPAQWKDDCPGERPATPIYMSDAPVTRLTWRHFIESGGLETPEYAVTEQSLETLNSFFASFNDYLNQNSQHLPTGHWSARLPTVDEWRLAVSGIVGNTSYQEFCSNPTIPSGMKLADCINCKKDAVAGSLKQKCRREEFRQSPSPPFYSLFGHHDQLCRTSGTCFLVGGNAFSTLDECIETLSMPKPLTNTTHLGPSDSFRVAIVRNE